MCLRFVYLLVVSGFSWPRLAARGGAWKDTELLLLCHQLRVLQRRQARKQRLTWANRALIAALARVIPKARQAGLRLVVTPDTVLRWHRDLLRRRWAAKSRAGCSGRPVIRRGIRRLVLRLARENQGLGIPENPRRTRRHGHPDRLCHSNIRLGVVTCGFAAGCRSD
jgi:putative transposase